MTKLTIHSLSIQQYRYIKAFLNIICLSCTWIASSTRMLMRAIHGNKLVINGLKNNQVTKVNHKQILVELAWSINLESSSLQGHIIPSHSETLFAFQPLPPIGCIQNLGPTLWPTQNFEVFTKNSTVRKI